MSPLTATPRRLDVNREQDVAELITRWQDDGDGAARDELIRGFTPLVRALARRYRNPVEPVDDLIQVASVGLIGAIDRFDTERGCAFRSYAIPTILGELKRYFRSTGWAVHVPRRAQELALRVERTTKELTAQLGRDPRPQELATAMQISIEDVLAGLDAHTAHFSTSLDASVSGQSAAGADEPIPLVDCLGSDDEHLDLVDAKLSVAAAMRQLPHCERVALQMRIEGDLRQVDIARRLGCSQMQVSRLLRSASAHVRQLTG